MGNDTTTQTMAGGMSATPTAVPATTGMGTVPTLVTPVTAPSGMSASTPATDATVVPTAPMAPVTPMASDSMSVASTTEVTPEPMATEPTGTDTNTAGGTGSTI